MIYLRKQVALKVFFSFKEEISPRKKRKIKETVLSRDRSEIMHSKATPYEDGGERGEKRGFFCVIEQAELSGRGGQPEQVHPRIKNKKKGPRKI